MCGKKQQLQQRLRDNFEQVSTKSNNCTPGNCCTCYSSIGSHGAAAVPAACHTHTLLFASEKEEEEEEKEEKEEIRQGLSTLTLPEENAHQALNTLKTALCESLPSKLQCAGLDEAGPPHRN